MVFGLIENQVSNLSYKDGWTELALHRLIQDLKYPILDSKIISKYERWKKEVLELTCKKHFDAQKANKIQ